MTIDADLSKKIILAMAQAIADQQAMLSQLDVTVGDGDHGHNLAKAFADANKQVQALSSADLQTIWRTAGGSIRDSVGGASGVLFGAFFTGAARTLAGKVLLTTPDVAEMLEAGLAVVQKRGKAKPGDKTLVDALAPAAEAAQKAANDNIAVGPALTKISEAALAGAEATRDMIAQHGRAKFLGERSVGHQDAGATSMAILLRAWADAVR